MNQLIPFNHPVFGQVRVGLDESGQRLLCGKDVCAAVGDSNHNRSLARLEPDERRLVTIDTPGGPQKLVFVTKPGFFNLILFMQPQKAHHEGRVLDEYPPEIQARIRLIDELKRWITHEVLPSIDETGRYELPAANRTPASGDPDSLLRLAEDWRKDRTRVVGLTAALLEKDAVIIRKDAVIAARDASIAEKDASIEELEFMLREQNQCLDGLLLTIKGHAAVLDGMVDAVKSRSAVVLAERRAAAAEAGSGDIKVDDDAVKADRMVELIRENTGHVVTQKTLFWWLRRNGYLHEGRGAKLNQATDAAKDAGLIRTVHYLKGEIMATYPLFTPKGQTRIVALFKGMESAPVDKRTAQRLSKAAKRLAKANLRLVK